MEVINRLIAQENSIIRPSIPLSNIHWLATNKQELTGKRQPIDVWIGGMRDLLSRFCYDLFTKQKTDQRREQVINSQETTVNVTARDILPIDR